MARPDPALLDPARYPFRTAVDPRFTDLDLNMHVNNVAMCGLLQEARVRFHGTSGYDRAVMGLSSMAASFSVAYVGEAYYPQSVEVHVGALSIGRTSHTVAQLALQEGRPVAYSEAVIVTVADGRPHPHPESFLEAMKDWMIRP